MIKKQSETVIQQQIIQTLSLYANRFGFVFMAPMNEGVMMVLTKFRVPKDTCFRIMNWFKKMGFLPGASDLQIFHDGKVYFIEVKSHSGKQSDGQILFMDNVVRAGCKYAVVRSVDDTLSFLKSWGVVR